MDTLEVVGNLGNVLKIYTFLYILFCVNLVEWQ